MIDEKRAKQNEEDFVAVKKVLAGDRMAFDFLQKKYKPILRSLIRKRVDNDDDVEDLIQETFIKVYNALETFKFEYSFYSWINRIASNNAIDFFRKKRFNIISYDKPIGDSEETYFEIGDKDAGPEIEMLRVEKSKIISEAINSLPENYKNIIKLRHEQDLDYKDIAEHLNIPLGTVKAHLFRARKLMLEHLKKYKNVFEEH